MIKREDIERHLGFDPETLTEAQLDTLEAIQQAGANDGEDGYYPDGDFSSDADWCNGIGELINWFERELDIDDGAVFDLYSEAHSEHFTDGTINPSDRDWMPRIFDFSFGAYADTEVSVHAKSVESGLELAADWLADNAPGHIMQPGCAELNELMAEVCAERGLLWPVPTVKAQTMQPEDWRPYWDAEQEAYSDLTYTEAGYISSDEWYVNERP
jgi:hypothetical protein